MLRPALSMLTRSLVQDQEKARPIIGSQVALQHPAICQQIDEPSASQKSPWHLASTPRQSFSECYRRSVCSIRTVGVIRRIRFAGHAQIYPSHMGFSESEVRLSCPRARRGDE